ncbi:MAG: hypothetical protein P8M16_08115 [Acidimicrobiales bacterium]|nr:hypothetical protein [Acidimicrobiales bacterium]
MVDRTSRRVGLLLGAGCLGVALFVVAGLGQEPADHWVTGAPLKVIPAQLVVEQPPDRTLDPYKGAGTWVDAYDFDPAYSPGVPSVVHADLASMAQTGLRTLFLQAARSDQRAVGLISDPWLLAGFLLAADTADIPIVGWYLPKWTVDDEDLDRLLAIDRFSVLGRRFAGLAVDIEWNRDDLGAIERSDRLANLSDRLRRTVGDDPLGAIVMPPVVTDEINPAFWPGFPWDELSWRYDVWLPMGYWSFRTAEHADPAFYTSDNIRRVRANLGNDDAVIHAIGGIGAADGTAVVDPGEPLASVDDLQPFVDALVQERAIGGSIYDWASMGVDARITFGESMVQMFPTVEQLG